MITKIILMNAFCIATLWSFNSDNSGQWINNGPFGAKVTTMAFDHTDTNIVYTGTYGSGVYRSIDSSNNWTSINYGIPLNTDTTIGSPTKPSWWFGDYYPITTIRILAQNSFHLYAGTYGGGVTQSFNKGETWFTTNTGLPNSALIRFLWIHPIDSTFLLCGTDYPDGGLYKSTDSGLSWTLVDSVPHNGTYYISTINNNPNCPDTIYVGVSSAGEPGLSWGILKTTDRGNSWEILSQDFSFFDLQIDPINAQKMWSVGYTGFGDWVLLFSDNGGTTWNFYPDVNDPWFDVIGLYTDKYWNLYVIDGKIFNGGVDLLRKSTDHGVSWNSFPFTLPSYPIGISPGMGPNMAVNPLNPKTVNFGTNVAVYRSKDGGQTYNIKESGMKNTYISAVAINPKNSQILYAGGDQGLWKTINGGYNWIRLNTKPVNAIAIDPKHPDTLYWGGNDLMRSYDGGQTWIDIRGCILGIITDIEIREDSLNIIYISSFTDFHGYLYKSYNYGTTSVKIFDSFPGSVVIEDIAIQISNQRIMYFGIGDNLLNHGLYKSIDWGNSWLKISDPGQISSIALHPYSPDTLFIATYDKIQVSSNGGVNFNEISQAIPSNNFSKILLDPENPTHLFCGTKDKGVFYSINSGQTWNKLQGEYDPRITDINYIAAQNKIYLATHGSGIWSADSTVLSIYDSYSPAVVTESMELLSAYPNPFNVQTTITFYLSKKDFIELSVYNIQGQLIKKYDRKTYPAGFNRITWNAINEKNQTVASGIYFIRLNTNSQNFIHKILLIK